MSDVRIGQTELFLPQIIFHKLSFIPCLYCVKSLVENIVVIPVCLRSKPCVYLIVRHIFLTLKCLKVCKNVIYVCTLLQWGLYGRDSVSNHQPHDFLLNRLFRCRSKKTSKLGVTGLCAGISPGTGEFPAQMASNSENVCIWWRHHNPSRCHLYFYVWTYILLLLFFLSSSTVFAHHCLPGNMFRS